MYTFTFKHPISCVMGINRWLKPNRKLYMRYDRMVTAGKNIYVAKACVVFLMKKIYVYYI